MRWWGAVVARRARVVLVVAVVLFAAAGVYGSGVFSGLKAGGFADPASESAFAEQEAKRVFGVRSPEALVVYRHDDLTVDDKQFLDELNLVIDRVEDAPGAPVEKVGRYVPGVGATAHLVSKDRHATLVTITLAGDTDGERTKSYEQVRPLLESAALDKYAAGSEAVFDDVNTLAVKDVTQAEMVALPLVFLLSILIFRSVVAAFMPVVVGVCSVVGAFAVVRGLSQVMDVSVFSINLITLLGMGLAVDYALFVVSRFREELNAVPPGQPVDMVAVGQAVMVTAGRTVFFSALVVAAALTSLLVFPMSFLSSMGFGGVAAVLVAMLSAVTVLPALLVVLGRGIDAGAVRLPWVGSAGGTQGSLWGRLGRQVMRRPVVVAVATTAVLVAMGLPFAKAQWGSLDERVLPEATESRVGSQMLRTDFGMTDMQAQVVVKDADLVAVGEYARRIAEAPGVEQAWVTEHRAGLDTSLVTVSWPGRGTDAAAQDVVRAIRDVQRPAGAHVWVGGQAAETVDLLAALKANLPIMALVVAVVMMVLLFMAFGSVVLPLKAIAMSVVSLGASFGVVSWIFSDGNLSGLLDFTPVGYIEATQPILMLAIIFGLSMDYEVFLLSRVREEWDRTQDNTKAVVVGMERTGSIITSAAILLGVVIGAFAMADVQVMKLMGIGMLVAVIVDATIVRGLLVPATMRLLGRANWWAPGPMARWWQRHGFTEH